MLLSRAGAGQDWTGSTTLVMVIVIVIVIFIVIVILIVIPRSSKNKIFKVL